MTDAELWRDVGAELRAIRERAGYRSTNALANAGGPTPTQKTMDAIERGRAGQVSRIGHYCRALGVTLADVLATVIARPSSVSADAMRLARLYDASSSTERRAIDALAAAFAAPPVPIARATPRGDERPGRGRARPGTDDGQKRTK